MFDEYPICDFLRLPAGVSRLTRHPANLLLQLAKARGTEQVAIGLEFDVVAYQRSECRDPSYNDFSAEHRRDMTCTVTDSMDEIDLSIEVARAARGALSVLVAEAFVRSDPLHPAHAIDLKQVEVGVSLFVKCSYGSDGVCDRLFLPACDLDNNVTEEQLPDIAKQLSRLYETLQMAPTDLSEAARSDPEGSRVSFYSTGNGYHAYVGALLHEGKADSWFSEVRKLSFVDERWARSSLRSARRNGVLRWCGGAPETKRQVPRRINL